MFWRGLPTTRQAAEGFRLIPVLETFGRMRGTGRETVPQDAPWGGVHSVPKRLENREREICS
jgi:hypothetical protein